jgi:hypothetical protein
MNDSTKGISEHEMLEKFEKAIPVLTQLIAKAMPDYALPPPLIVNEKADKDYQLRIQYLSNLALHLPVISEKLTPSEQISIQEALRDCYVGVSLVELNRQKAEGMMLIKTLLSS